MKAWKILCTAKNLCQYATRKQKFPLWIVFKLTYTCNSKCIYCSHRNQEQTELDLESVRKVIDKISKDCAILSLSGGEPTLREDLPEIIRYIKRKSIFLILSTNGTNLPMIRKVVPYINCLNVSLDGPREVHNRHSNIDSYDKAIESIKLARSYNKKTVINYVLTRYNHDQAENTLQIARELDCGIIFMDLVSSEHSTNCATLEPDEKRSFWKKVEILKSRFPKIIYNSTASIKIASGEMIPTGPCKSGKLHFFIDPKGNIFACKMDPSNGRSLLTEEKLQTILESVDHLDCRKNNCLGALNRHRDLKPYIRLTKEILSR